MKYILFLIPLLFFVPTQSQALSCISEDENQWFAAYLDGQYVDGFTVEHISTGNWCDERPVVGENRGLEETFDLLISNSNEADKTGVFHISTKCVTESSREGCFPISPLEKISSNSVDIEKQRLSWLQKEQNAARASSTHKWSTFGLILAVLSCLVLWPWAFVLKWPHLQIRIVSLLVIAIPIQLIMIFLTPVFDWSYPLVNSTSRFAATAVMLIIGIEVLYIFLKLSKRRKSKILVDNKEI